MFTDNYTASRHLVDDEKEQGGAKAPHRQENPGEQAFFRYPFHSLSLPLMSWRSLWAARNSTIKEPGGCPASKADVVLIYCTVCVLT
jgi:hypothetical protein